ncbi:MAG: hypothetical protein AYK22_04780 [Thermoplasmatales archaeon SG8-52-3]|nr:MAG: hypothetical protein AYK22_04780 [Thermoplasmatales archaeon SG8-52-3]
MKLFELAYACHIYREFSDFDTTYERFLRETKPNFDILNPRHRKALLVWLNSWGCRQFSINFHEKASEQLRIWGQKNFSKLPTIGTSLLIFTDNDFVNAGTLYVNLRDMQASIRQRNGKSESVKFGPTGAAKILFALRDQAFPPWDDSIRNRLDYDGSQKSYIKYLQWVKNELQEVITDAEMHSIAENDIPKKLGRSSSSLPKLVNEYNYITITQGCKPPNLEDINKWLGWARG